MIHLKVDPRVDCVKCAHPLNEHRTSTAHGDPIRRVCAVRGIGRQPCPCGDPPKPPTHGVLKRLRDQTLAIVAITFAIVGAGPTMARADTTASYSTTLAIFQAIDAIQTQTGLHRSECVTFNYIDAVPRKSVIVCHPPLFYEADPFAKPFVHGGYVPTILAGAALNLGASTFARHNKTAAILMRIGVALYPLLLVHNGKDLHLQATYNYEVPVK